MNSQELRIGNWIIENLIDEPRFIQVEKIVKDDDWSDCSPIPLTSDILLKCGFVQAIDGRYEYILDNEYLWRPFRICLTTEERYAAADLEPYNNDFDWHFVDHLHQLQNLFYCLSGTELNITLP